MKGVRAWYWRAGAWLAGFLMRLVPRGWRYPLAFRTAMLVAPLLRRTSLYTYRLSPHDGPREETLRLFIRAMVKLRVPFDPEVTVDGAELLPSSPVLLASGHFMLASLLIRWLHDRGARPTAVRWNPTADITVVGTNLPADLIANDRDVYVRVRSRLAAGHAVVVFPDYSREFPNSIPLEGPRATTYVVDTHFRFAERTSTPLLFAAVRIDGGRARITIRRPSTGDAATMTREFCAFYVSEANQVG